MEKNDIVKVFASLPDSQTDGAASKEYVRQRRLEVENDPKVEVGWEAEELDSEECRCLKGCSALTLAFEIPEEKLKEIVLEDLVISMTATVDESKGTFPVRYKYNPKAEYNKLQSSIMRHDGTLLFEIEGIANLFQKIFKGFPKYEGEDILRENPKGKELLVEYGDFVIINKFDEGAKEKPWMRQRTFMYLPMRYSVVESEENG